MWSFGQDREDLYEFEKNLFGTTSSTAQGGGGSFKNWKPIGKVGWL